MLCNPAKEKSSAIVGYSVKNKNGELDIQVWLSPNADNHEELEIIELAKNEKSDTPCKTNESKQMNHAEQIAFHFKELQRLIEEITDDYGASGKVAKRVTSKESLRAEMRRNLKIVNK